MDCLRRILPSTLLGVLLMTVPADSAAAQSSSAADWAIAIHGGAGSDAADWPAERRAARRAGLERALRRGQQVLADGGRAIDAVEQAIRTLEDDAHFNAGRGAVLTSDGEVELDASIMDGANAACGAVAGVTTITNAITLARRVMSETPHVLLIGSGAERFAAAQEVERVAPDYFFSWRQRHGGDRANAEVAPEPAPVRGEHLGTVGCVARDQEGHLAAGTSTGGMTNKMPGRVGDSPVVGAGTYAADRFAAVSGTGRGEEYIRHAVAYDVVAQMRYAGRPLEEAVERILVGTLPPGSGGMIAVGADGTVVLRHNTPGMSCGAADSRGRFDIYLAVEGDPPQPESSPESARQP